MTPPVTCLSLAAATLVVLSFTGCQQMGYKPGSVRNSASAPNSSNLRDLRQHTFEDDTSVRCIEPVLTPDESTLLFTLAKDAGRSGYRHDIYVKPVNGKARTQKTFHEYDDWGGVISPDGTKVAFASSRNGSSDIFVMNFGGGRAKRQITSGDLYDVSPSWSHDGRRIAFSRYSFTAQEWEIWTFDFDTGALTSLVPGLFPQCSPRDNTILFQRWDSTLRRYAIWTVDEDGFIESQLIASSSDSFTQPQWSPDATRIVFCSGAKLIDRSLAFSRSSRSITFGSAADVWEFRANDIWIANRDGSGLTQLTDTEGGEFTPHWASDGRIYFALDRDDAVNIWSALPETIELDPLPVNVSQSTEG